MAQLNVEIDDQLLQRIKIARVEDGVKLKKWVATACEMMLDFDNLAMARCRELGWAPGNAFAAKEPIEVIEEPPSEPPERVKKP
jgi:hypothetical protein